MSGDLHKCPVCGGRGFVPAGFYGEPTAGSAVAKNETCRACKGRGFIPAWEVFADKRLSVTLPPDEWRSV